ncbi:MAG: hypothetical protein SNJ85_02760 [Cyanobacteriota bacterium]
MANNNKKAWDSAEELRPASLNQDELTDNELETVAGGWCGNGLRPRFPIPMPGPVDPFRGVSLGNGLLLSAVQKVHKRF